MTCSSCKYLNENKKLDGKVSGCEYFCNKNKHFVNGQNNACNKYGSTNRCNEIYNEGKDFHNDIHSVSYYLFILIIVIIIAIIARISNPELYPF